MTESKRADFVSALDRIRDLPSERRGKIEAGAARILEQMHLSEIRKALDTTQAQLAGRTGMKQAEISRVENHAEACSVMLRASAASCSWWRASRMG
jgi:hypothetical protein